MKIRNKIFSKTYAICSFEDDDEDIDFLNEIYLIDRNKKQIYLYASCNYGENVTKKIIRKFGNHMEEPNRPLGCILIEIMNGKNRDGFLYNAFESDDAKEISKVLWNYRIKQLESKLHFKKIGFPTYVEDSCYPEYFSKL